MNAVVIVALAAILGLTGIVLKMLADGRERMRLLAPQIRVAAPPKAAGPKDDEDLLAQLAAAKRAQQEASGVAAIGHHVVNEQQGEA